MSKRIRKWWNRQMSKLICLLSNCDGMCGYHEHCSDCRAYHPDKTHCDIPD